MAELYFPFASNNGDRMVGVETYERMLGSIFTQGVYPRGEMLAVTAAGNMAVQISTGSAILVRAGERASLYHNTQPLELQLSVADGLAGRMDTVVLRRDNSRRMITAVVVQGVPASSPQPVAPVRDADVWEIVLCKIHVPAGATEITQANIIDCRMDSELCGVVSSIAQLDTAKLYAQYDALFYEWFDGIKGVLEGEDVAGELATAIANLKIEVSALDASNAQLTQGVAGKADKSAIVSGTLLAAGWSAEAPYMQKLFFAELAAVNGQRPNGIAEWVHASDAPTESERKSAWNLIDYFEQDDDGWITAKCLKRVPTVDLPVNILIVG